MQKTKLQLNKEQAARQSARRAIARREEIEAEAKEVLGNLDYYKKAIKLTFKASLPPVKKGPKLEPHKLMLSRAWKTTALKLAAQGASMVEIMLAIGVKPKRHARLLKETTPKGRVYRAVMTEAKNLCEAWWLQVGRKGLTMGTKFNSSLYYMNMKNRFGWKDKNETEFGKETLSVIEDKMREIAKRGRANK